MGISLHTMFLLNDHTVKVCGGNTFGQLGLGNDTKRDTPTIIPDLTNVKQISCGFQYTLFLLNDDTVKVCGYNSNGQLGLGNDTISIKKPTVAPELKDVKQVSCGQFHTIFLLNDGIVKVCGYNNYGQLGLGDTNNRYISTLIPNLTNVKQISCGYNHTLFLLNDGTVKVCGNNSHGQLGLGNNTTDRNIPTLIPNLNNVKQISCGGYHTVFLLNDGTVKVCGNNVQGQLGLGDITNRNIPTLIPNLKNVKQISCGSNYTLFLFNDGTVKVCGDNRYGQLGLGDNDSRNIPTLIPNLTNVKQISCGNGHSTFLLDDRTVKICGYNNEGQLGLGDTTNRNIPTLIPDLTNVKSLHNIMDSYYFKYLFKNNMESFGYYEDDKIIVNKSDLVKVKLYGLDNPDDILRKDTKFDNILRYYFKE